MRAVMTILSFAIVIFALIPAAFSEVKLQRTEFTYNERTFTGDLVTHNGTHFLNKLAKKLDHDLDGLKIIVSDEVLSSVGANGAYDMNQNNLLISSETMEKASADLTLRHEVVHAKIWHALRRGEPYTFSGLAYNTEKDLENRPYGPFFGIDEVIATLFSMKEWAQALKLALDRASNKDKSAVAVVVDTVFETRYYIRRLETMLTTLKNGITDGLKKSARPPKLLSFVPDDIKWVKINTETIRIYFPATVSNDELLKISKFSQESIETIVEAEEIGAKVQILNSKSKQIKASEQFLDHINSILESFEAEFPADYSVIQ